MNAQASQTTRDTIPLGGIAGIPISPDYSWFLIFGLLAWLLATQHFPAEFPGWSPLLYWSVGAVTAILLPPSAGAEFRIAIAGPLVSLALAALFYALQTVTGDIQPLYALAKYLAYINLALGVFNLIPGYPLDGGRVFRAIVWAMSHDLQRATLIAATVGRGFGFLFIGVGVWQMLGGNLVGGIWIAFIGWFLESAAADQTAQVAVRGALADRR